VLESSSRFDAAGENLKSHNDLTQGSELRAIIGMTLPMMVGMVGMVAFNLVDTYFVGQLGTDALAAMSFTLPVVFMQSAISMGLGVGASAVIARAIGEKNPQRVKRLTTDALILSLVIVFCFVLIGLLTIDPLFSMLGADAGSIILIGDTCKSGILGWFLS
jgi:Na+-driven multidrug efflux pump